MKTLKLLFFIVLLAINSSCGTTIHRVGVWKRPFEKFDENLYRATCADIHEIGPNMNEHLIIPFMFLLSLPFDVVIDTVCLPYDVWAIRIKDPPEQEP